MNVGFFLVMYDGFYLSFEENIGNMWIVVEMVWLWNIMVEGELGVIGGLEDGKVVVVEDICFIIVEDVMCFVKEIQVDMLVVFVGIVYGLYIGKVQIQYVWLKVISEVMGVLLVLYGGIGVSDEDMWLVVIEGINKVNVGMEMNVQWVDCCKLMFEKGKVNDSVWKFLIFVNQVVIVVLMEKMVLFKQCFY